MPHLCVHVLAVSDLPSTSSEQPPLCAVRLTINNSADPSFETSTPDSARNTFEWKNESFDFKSGKTEPITSLQLTVLHKDTIMGDEELDSASVDNLPDKLTRQVPLDEWVSLSKTSSAKIHIRLLACDFGKEDGEGGAASSPGWLATEISMSSVERIRNSEGSEEEKGSKEEEARLAEEEFKANLKRQQEEARLNPSPTTAPPTAAAGGSTQQTPAPAASQKTEPAKAVGEESGCSCVVQ